DALNTEKVFAKEYKEETKNLNELIEKVELGKADKIDKDKEKVLKSMKALEVRAIRYTALHEADTIKNKAKEKNAIKLAPVTYAEAVKAYQAAEATINADPHNKEKVKAASDSAVFAANHVLNVTERVVQLQKNIKDNAEQVVTSEEKLLLKISKSVNDKDYRDQPFKKQVSSIVEDAKALAAFKTAQSNSEAEIKNLNEEIKTLKTKLDETIAALEKSKTELDERNNQVVKLTADLVQMQNKEQALVDKVAKLEANGSVTKAPAEEPAVDTTASAPETAKEESVKTDDSKTPPPAEKVEVKAAATDTAEEIAQ
ncbi:MAG: hypothetical protein R3240_03055, partial [Gammaproteobacteria bacterium]|nr:hypothetical protein [Gammaproteobacteria bacterium]